MWYALKSGDWGGIKAAHVVCTEVRGLGGIKPAHVVEMLFTECPHSSNIREMISFRHRDYNVSFKTLYQLSISKS